MVEDTRTLLHNKVQKKKEVERYCVDALKKTGLGLCCRNHCRNTDIQSAVKSWASSSG